MASALSGQTMTANSEYTFLVSRDLLLTLATEGHDSVGLYCTVYRADSLIAREIKETILLANYGCAGTSGATLGIFSEDNSVLLAQIIPCADAIPETRLLEIGFTFINTCMQWHDRLNNFQGRAPKLLSDRQFDGFLKI
jgi:hypothetical protein